MELATSFEPWAKELAMAVNTCSRNNFFNILLCFCLPGCLSACLLACWWLAARPPGHAPSQLPTLRTRRAPPHLQVPKHALRLPVKALRVVVDAGNFLVSLNHLRGGGEHQG